MMHSVAEIESSLSWYQRVPRYVISAGIILAVFGSPRAGAREDSATQSSNVSDATGTSDDDRQAAVEQLRPLGVIVGDWRGVAQPRRGSSVGSWAEKLRVTWMFEESRASLRMVFESGQQFQSAVFSPAESGKITLILMPAAGGEPLRLNELPENDAAVDSGVKRSDTRRTVWRFESSLNDGRQIRCTLRLISEIRVTLLFEDRLSETASYRRIFETGLTREGERLAAGGTGERECIVTGGLGTIPVSFGGKTYYVCCEGCVQVFNADPAGTVAEYRSRLKK